MIDKYCRACGKRISLAEEDLYGGFCNMCHLKMESGMSFMDIDEMRW